jgi:hypothetical protein
MPDISKFKSVSVSAATHTQLEKLAKNYFEVPVSVHESKTKWSGETLPEVGKIHEQH